MIVDGKPVRIGRGVEAPAQQDSGGPLSRQRPQSSKT